MPAAVGWGHSWHAQASALLRVPCELAVEGGLLLAIAEHALGRPVFHTILARPRMSSAANGHSDTGSCPREVHGVFLRKLLKATYLVQ